MSKAKTNHLKDLLQELGIQPSSFAYFLMQYRKQQPQNGSAISGLLDAQLKGQAKLILYHLTH